MGKGIGSGTMGSGGMMRAQRRRRAAAAIAVGVMARNRRRQHVQQQQQYQGTTTTNSMYVTNTGHTSYTQNGGYYQSYPTSQADAEAMAAKNKLKTFCIIGMVIVGFGIFFTIRGNIIE